MHEPRYPLYVLLPDERTFKKATTPLDLQWFEQIDVEDAEHVAWDLAGSRYHLAWNGAQRRIVPIFDAPGDHSSFLLAANTYIAHWKLHQYSIGKHIYPPLLLEQDLKHLQRN